MPYRNEHGTPRWIYRIDSRPPSIIFTEGFSPWGSNNDFFTHILGYSLDPNLPVEQRSLFISASDSPNSAIRFFGAGMSTPFTPTIHYLYQIRADENVYSAARTASRLLARLATGSLILEEGTYERAYLAIHAVFNNFAYQREWFNVGVISHNRIHSAWLVDYVEIDPDHIRRRHGAINLYYTPRINDPEIMNDHYLNLNTLANNLPYDPSGNDLANPLTVTVPENIVEADASGGVAASLGFACSYESPTLHHRIDEYESDKKYTRNEFCYFDSGLVKKSFSPNKPITLFSNIKIFPIYFKGSESNLYFSLSWDYSKQTPNKLELIPLWQAPEKNKFIYDNYYRFSSKSKDTSLTFAITAVPTEIVTVQKVIMDLATTNDQKQKFTFEKVDDEKEYETWRVIVNTPKGYSLHRKLGGRDNNLYLLHKANLDPIYEEIHVVISPQLTDWRVLLTQKSNSNLIDIGLSWYYERQNYAIIPETGFSKEGLTREKTFFYDLDTYQVLYINRKYQIFGLYNQRDVAKFSWDWVRWKTTSLASTQDIRKKWYILNFKWIKNPNEINYRNIKSFYQNDWLRVVVRGSNWGALYTTYLSGDINSIALFNIFASANI